MKILLINFFLAIGMAFAAQLEINNVNPENSSCQMNSYRYNLNCVCNPGFENNQNNQCIKLKSINFDEAVFNPNEFPDVEFDNNCSPDDRSVISNNIGYAKDVIKKIFAYATYFVQNDQESPEKANLKKAIDTLRCIDDHLTSMGHDCHSTSRNCYSYDGATLAYVNWRFGTTVHWCEAGQRRNIIQAGENNSPNVANLIHEISHKCGTFDSHRMVAKSVYNAPIVSWEDIASTYESWALYGFCYPNKTSPSFCNINGRKHPIWMDNSPFYIPVLKTRIMLDKEKKLKDKYQSMLNEGSLTEEEVRFLLGN
ncbi:MAG: hypothetical protein A2381_19995 [Bdellovibrionales bacterium RIFOXYB1_FULL_37_110]|nr:MAG: hypothetical protein A2181_03630 [Bdellovibrionales bacterium RIFOXYA1_FULL_38_20]OFZ51020.1 MAG: hypothetical protein A2417_19780 [Bdellovibrionales bacterium RIFOXYC1_FULL_37_79]OFZ60232.1 MAG: hypothetical protein A2381_19995 [Bdellovibrionales bacterium RIFOXYB1_FULL_37_110]OFZ63227.1 MAG: hypothetical protein A2577_01310 [Bdellovibrionales bacterium RIFOXYD1_FULL_36_51]